MPVIMDALRQDEPAISSGPQEDAPHVDESEGDSDSDATSTSQSGQVNAALLHPMSLPADVLRMVFAEFLSKPSVHFASFRFSAFAQGRPVTMELRPWSDLKAGIRSGYVLQHTLEKTCRLAREVATRPGIATSTIRYDKGYAKIDPLTELLCLVYGKTAADRFTWHEALTPYLSWYPPLDFEAIGEKLGQVRRAGVLVTKGMWYEALRCWFGPMRDLYSLNRYLVVDGRLNEANLAALMSCFQELECFYFVLTDIAVDEWDAYYKKFPVAFHDHTGSYVEAYETPVAYNIIFGLWTGPDFPYPPNSKPNIGDDPNFLKRVDAQMGPATRVSILLGILLAARVYLMEDVTEVLTEDKVRVLARKPTSMPSGCSTSPATQTPLAESVGDGLDRELGPDDPEALWVQQALLRIVEGR